jgi:hypothetical protein
LEDNFYPYPQLSASFFENGMIHQKGIIDMYNGLAAMPVSLWEEYDSLGILIETIYYLPDENGKDFILIEKYADGKLISSKKYNNYVQYESEPIEKK